MQETAGCESKTENWQNASAYCQNSMFVCHLFWQLQLTNFSWSHQHRKWHVNTAPAPEQPFSSRPECECLVCASQKMLKQTQTKSRFRGQFDRRCECERDDTAKHPNIVTLISLEILMNTSSVKPILMCYSRKCYTAYNEQPIDPTCFRVIAGIREGLYIWWG